MSESFSFISPADVFLRKFYGYMHPIQLLTDASASSSASGYLPIGIQLIFAAGFVFFMIGLSAWLGPKRKTSDKLENFASGIESHGNARQPMAIKYFLVAILFVLFDVEVIFFYPYAVNFRELGWSGFGAVLMFVGFFLYLKIVKETYFLYL